MAARRPPRRQLTCLAPAALAAFGPRAPFLSTLTGMTANKPRLQRSGIVLDSLDAQARTDFQPQEDVRVYLAPAGHPCCLFRSG